MLEQVSPNRLRAGIAAPCATDRTRYQEKSDAGHDQEASDEVELVRPDLDVEHVKAAVGEIDQHGLIGRIRTAIPADPRGAVVNRQCHDRPQPLHPSVWAIDLL